MDYNAFADLTESIGSNADGRLEMFVLGGDSNLYHMWQKSANGVWTGWASLGGADLGLYTSPVVSRNADGRLEVFAKSNEGIYTIWQTARNGGWSGWESLGGNMNGNDTFSVGINHDGTMELFAPLLTDPGALWHAYQTGPNQGWSNWSMVDQNTVVTAPTVGANADGRLQVFDPRFDAGASFMSLHTIHQTSPGGPGWSAWSSLNGKGEGMPSVVRNTDGRLEVFWSQFDNTPNSIWHIWQTGPNGDWSEWKSLGDGFSTARPAVACYKDGRLGVFGINMATGALWQISQLAASGLNWSEWESLGGNLKVSNPPGMPEMPSVGVYPNTDGRLQAFGMGADGAIWTTWQKHVADWSGSEWLSLGVP